MSPTRAPNTRAPSRPAQPDQARASARPLAVAVIGVGAIGGAVAEALENGDVPGARLVAALRSSSTSGQVTAALEAADVLVEAASVEAAEELIPRITSAGKDVIVCSCGVFARHETKHDLVGSGPGRVLVPAGAVGGLDVLAAAARAGTESAVLRHFTIKSPAALGVDEPLDAPREVFRGSAREAALEFPRTSNASVALALATIGLDRVEVIVVADPEVERTRHVVEWESPMGSYDMRFENSVDPDSGGRTSAITAWSVIEVLSAISAGVGPGVVVVGVGRPVEGTSGSS
ncbi:aspartate dehydrogenase domain-containing protein [Rhodococcus sp. IEGM 1408]|uniref:aspartate dehydrogenase domain-containing protein n=1 Tax=Rhodococcus sp. IEGM 1408 TaxID=3082220 RepID=UPI002953C543|nr:aspartate dehydrogenase domain-containing protein [Rhodococcus sp. IEGM 1408]MDV8001389.1 aspartate dehydrogenase domain-containing protein [Rhodococcus sp. IEGM 1408]